jgi:hypothetical protein
MHFHAGPDTSFVVCIDLDPADLNPSWVEDTTTNGRLKLAGRRSVHYP